VIIKNVRFSLAI